VGDLVCTVKKHQTKSLVFVGVGSNQQTVFFTKTAVFLLSPKKPQFEGGSLDGGALSFLFFTHVFFFLLGGFNPEKKLFFFLFSNLGAWEGSFRKKTSKLLPPGFSV